MIRIAVQEDAQALLSIYSYYVEHTAVTFEYEPPSAEEFRNRIVRTLRRYPYLVAERDGAVLGYAYAGPFKERRAYDWAVETTIYVDKEARGTGLGRKLYTALEQTLTLQNVLNLNACIACPIVEDEYLTGNSIKYHEHMGYDEVGRFSKCGYKFGRWYDMVWMEKHLGPHPETPEPVKPLDAVREELAARYGIR